jgi:hypothetical protein
MKNNMNQRAEHFYRLYCKGLTYRAIANDNNLTPARVQQILKKHFPVEMKELISKRGWYVGKRKPAKDFPEFTCLNCGKKQKSKYRYHPQKFCNSKCKGQFMKKLYSNA